MTKSAQDLNSSDIHPIDIVENLAEYRAWDFDRVTDDQIAMEVEGAWRQYHITLAWSNQDETLRMICTFEMEPPREKMAELYEALNLANDNCWAGGFSFWKDHRLMVYRYGLVLSGGATALPEQIDQLLHTAVSACEKYYPAFQLTCWGETTPEASMDIAIAEAYGRA